MKHTGRTLTFIAALLAGTVAQLHGAADTSLGGLLRQSPFGAAGAPAGAASPLEFRGVLVMNGRVMLGLLDRTTAESFWVDAGDPDAVQDITVHSYDARHERLEVVYHGRPLTLSLAVARILDQDLPAPDGEDPAGAPGGIAVPWLEASAPQWAEGVQLQQAVRPLQLQADAEQIDAGLRLLAGG